MVRTNDKDLFKVVISLVSSYETFGGSKMMKFPMKVGNLSPCLHTKSRNQSMEIRKFIKISDVY